MPTASETLTARYRREQTRRGAAVAALVAAYFRNKVDLDDPQAVDDWLNLMVPRVISGSDVVARLAAKYAEDTRRLELPGTPVMQFDVATGVVPEQARKSLLVAGPASYAKKARQIEEIDVDPQQRAALLSEAKEVAARRVAGSTMRHVQNGGRQTVIQAAATDPAARGYVRTTTFSPCFFCAMLASRGLVFEVDSFDESDPRFIGDGTAKVHDNCACGMKVVYVPETDSAMQRVKPYEEMWARWGSQGGDSLHRFRVGYEHFLKTGEYLTNAEIVKRFR